MRPRVGKQPSSGHFSAHRRDAIGPFLQNLTVTLTEHDFAKTMDAQTNFGSGRNHDSSVPATRPGILLAGALNSVEELPPQVERALDRGPYFRSFHFAHRGMTENAVADVAVIAIGDFMHVEKRDLLPRKSVMLFKRARERREVARDLALCREIDCGDSLRERAILGRELEPVYQRRRRRQRLAMDQVVAAKAKSESETDEQFGMRRAAGNLAGLLFVQALRELHALLGVEASRMQRTQRTREFTHLQEELSREGAQSGLRGFSIGNSMPNRMASERAPLFDHRENLAHESVTHCCHRATSHAGDFRPRRRRPRSRRLRRTYEISEAM